MLNRDFKEFIQLLKSNGVRYLVVGGYALAVHGHPRYTKDIDIWIALSPENAASIIKALDQFGFGSLGLTENDFLVEGHTIQLGNPPNRIDILCSVSGVEFNDCYEKRIETEIDGVTVNFIDIESLKINKKASGRLQDLADIEALE